MSSSSQVADPGIAASPELRMRKCGPCKSGGRSTWYCDQCVLSSSFASGGLIRVAQGMPEKGLEAAQGRVRKGEGARGDSGVLSGGGMEECGGM